MVGRHESQPSYRLLVVEDDPHQRDVLGKYFDAKLPEATITFADDVDQGILALDASTDRPFGMVVTDRNLPDGTGFDVSRKAKDVSKDTMVLLYSSQVGGISDEDIEKAGIDRTMEKGSPRDLVVFVKDYFQQQTNESS